MFKNLLHLCQFKQHWFRNLLGLLAHLHRVPHQILDLLHLQIDHLLHLQIDHLPHLQIHLKTRHLQIHLRTHHFLNCHLSLHLQNHLSLHQLVRVKLVPQIPIQQFDLLLEQDRLEFYLIQDFKQVKFLKYLKHQHFKKAKVRLYIS